MVNHFFFSQVAFSGAVVGSWEHINRPSRGHTPVELSAVLSVTRQLCPTRSKQPLDAELTTPVSQPDISSACLFHLFNKQHKLNLLVCLIFSCNHTFVYNR